MVLINKQPKISFHMASMPINDRRLKPDHTAPREQSYLGQYYL